MGKRDLFEDLKQMVGCPFISDLRTDKYIKKAKSCFFKLDVSKYRMADVHDMLKYLEISK